MGEAEIEEDDIEGRVFQHLVRRMGIGDRHCLVFVIPECPFQSTAQRRLVIDNEDAGGHEAT
jgi:hypothetical protein